jgi:hypothetical protein
VHSSIIIIILLHFPTNSYIQLLQVYVGVGGQCNFIIIPIQLCASVGLNCNNSIARNGKCKIRNKLIMSTELTTDKSSYMQQRNKYVLRIHSDGYTHFVLPLLIVITWLWSDLVAWTTLDVGVNVLSASIEWTRRNSAPPSPQSVRCILLSWTNRVVTILVGPVFSSPQHILHPPIRNLNAKRKQKLE